MKFFVTDDCIGCGLCNSICPEVFEMTDDGMAKALDVSVTGQVEALSLQAQEQCPVNAIEAL